MDEVVLHVKQHVEKIANSWHHSKQAHQKAAYTCIMLEVVLLLSMICVSNKLKCIFRMEGNDKIGV